MKELTHEDWVKNPTPREMWVWDHEGALGRAFVVYIQSEEQAVKYHSIYRVRTITSGYKHCAEIEKPKKRPCTREELLEMLKKQGLSLLKLKGDTENYTINIRSLNDREITIANGECFKSYEKLCECYTLLDGTELWVEKV